MGLLHAANSLQALINQPVVPLRSSRESAENLLSTLRRISMREDQEGVFGFDDYFGLFNALNTFKANFNAETSIADTYVVTPKRGYDTVSLIQSGEILFPADLPAKVPEAILDVREATRCIAFELPTAAAFHLFRAVEAVLYRYYDTVTNGKPRPKSRNMGDFINALETIDAGEKRVRSALRDLKDLHRNPLVHPEHSLSTIDEAVALLGGVQSVVVHMLAAIPYPKVALPPWQGEAG